ncbi:MAG: esterase/lipase-like protein [Rhizobium sp.]|nr:esterase/lipase-like protein [Rhizobium sp.]
MFIFKTYRKPKGLNMAFEFSQLSRLSRIAASSILMLGAACVASQAGTNPLEDFNSTQLTSDFRDQYSGVGNATVNIDVPYGLDGAQKYDVYLPEERANAPIIVMVHGGAWTSGDKQDDNVARAKAGYFVAKGYIFVSLNYRLLPKSDPLIQAADVALGIANIQKNAIKWDGDKSKIVLMGSGAGGHITALLSSNPSLASDQGATVWAGAVVLETAALNIPGIMSGNHDNRYDTAFGSNAEFWEDSSPAHLVDSSGVPILVVCSTESNEDTCAKANAFKQNADNAGVNVTVSPQSMSPWEVNSRVGVSTSYTDTIGSYIDSLL